MCVAIHSNDKCLDMYQSFMPCIARKYLRIRNATYFYKALIFWFFYIKVKEQKNKLNMNPSNNRKLQKSKLQFTPQLLYLIRNFQKLGIRNQETSHQITIQELV